jgi:hypothetical protein
MKKKSLNYVLGFAVVLIWGMIFYQIFKAYWKDDAEPQIPATTYREKAYNDYAVKKDTSTLKLNYRDPFKLSVTIVADTAHKKLTSRIASMIHPVAKTDWSFIKYSGYIANPVTRKVISILIINGNSVMLAEGESAGDVKLVKNMRDSVQIIFKKSSRYISRATI